MSDPGENPSYWPTRGGFPLSGGKPVGWKSDGLQYPDWYSDETRLRVIKRWLSVGNLAAQEENQELLDQSLRSLYDLLHD